jgi:hypothetical protein
MTKWKDDLPQKEVPPPPTLPDQLIRAAAALAGAPITVPVAAVALGVRGAIGLSQAVSNLATAKYKAYVAAQKGDPPATAAAIQEVQNAVVRVGTAAGGDATAVAEANAQADKQVDALKSAAPAPAAGPPVAASSPIPSGVGVPVPVPDGVGAPGGPLVAVAGPPAPGGPPVAASSPVPVDLLGLEAAASSAAAPEQQVKPAPWAADWAAALHAKGVRAMPAAANRLRLVTHADFTDEHLEFALGVFRSVVV